MSLIISALAGTGKTFTLIGGVKCSCGKRPTDVIASQQQNVIWNELARTVKPDSICFAAFNVSVKDVIKSRLSGSTYCDIVTMHGMGYQTIKNMIGISGDIIQVDKFKTDKLIEIVHNGTSIRILYKTKPGYPGAVKRLVQLSKYNTELEPSDRTLAVLAGQYDIALGDNSELIFDTTRKVLNLASKDYKRIDFDDMPWLPIVLGMSIRKYDMLVIDEGQDLNPCQQQLMLRAGEQIVLAGDKHQAIYGFAGADVESMDTMFKNLSKTDICKVFPLTITRRCSQAVTEEAQHIVPEFTAHENNPPGSVKRTMSYNNPTPGDMILCRINAPLIRRAYGLAIDGIPVEILGRNISVGLINLIQMLKPTSINDLQTKLHLYEQKETKRIRAKRYRSEAALIAISDRCNCLYTFCNHNDSVDGVIADIKSLFSTKKSNSIRLSSIHQAKGLEAQNVFILRPDLLPHPLAQSSWQLQQEKNLKYVAITRAIRNLTWIDDIADY